MSVGRRCSPIRTAGVPFREKTERLSKGKRLRVCRSSYMIFRRLSVSSSEKNRARLVAFPFVRMAMAASLVAVVTAIRRVS